MMKSKINDLKKLVMAILLRYRWLAILFVLSFLTLIEFLEHPNFSVMEKAFVFEVVAFLLFIVVIGILIELVLRSDQRLKQTLLILTMRHEFSQVLSSAKSIDELAGLIFDSVREIVPVVDLRLLAFNHVGQEILTLAQWPEGSNFTIEDQVCEKCTLQEDAFREKLIACDHKIEPGFEGSPRQCLSLEYGDHRAGILIMILPENQPLTGEQSRILENVATEFAFALHTASLQREQRRIEVDNAISTERLAIARDLHDTLGQNLGYVHFSLDKILATEGRLKNKKLKAELSQLRELSNESYELVRNTLVILHKSDAHNFTDLFRAQATMIAERAGFVLDLQEFGQPISLSPRHLTELAFVIKEMMRNIERHSEAKNVRIKLNWEPETLLIEMTDDGIGFDPQAGLSDGHYGLNIIQERVSSLGGRFIFTGAINQGTSATINIPLGGKRYSKGNYESPNR